MADSVLAHIAASITQKENLATEALAFILNRSPAARGALAMELKAITGKEQPIAFVRTQVAAGDESRPDLLLVDERAQVVGYVEAKFWAGLTDAQPVKYLERLREVSAGTLVFLAPDRRLPTLRAELLQRCHGSGLPVSSPTDAFLRQGDVDIVILSWSRLLKVVAGSVVGETATESDIRQLGGLCAQFETEGFIPLTRDELDDLEVPRRILSLAALVDPIVGAASAKGLISVDGLRPSHSMGATGRYVRMPRAAGWLGITYTQWAARGRSPMWIYFERGEPGRGERVAEAVRQWTAVDPPRAFIDDGSSVKVPLLLKAGAEREAVVAHVVEQLTELDGLMKAVGMEPLRTDGSAAPSGGT